MAAAQSNRKCSACGRALSGEDEWISLDGGEVWCAECWQEQFGPEPQAAPEEEPAFKEIQADDLEGLAEGEQITSDQMKNLRPCTNCGHLCAPGTEICPACGGEFDRKPWPTLRHKGTSGRAHPQEAPVRATSQVSTSYPQPSTRAIRHDAAEDLLQGAMRNLRSHSLRDYGSRFGLVWGILLLASGLLPALVPTSSEDASLRLYFLNFEPLGIAEVPGQVKFLLIYPLLAGSALIALSFLPAGYGRGIGMLVAGLLPWFVGLSMAPGGTLPEGPLSEVLRVIEAQFNRLVAMTAFLELLLLGVFFGLRIQKAGVPSDFGRWVGGLSGGLFLLMLVMPIVPGIFSIPLGSVPLTMPFSMMAWSVPAGVLAFLCMCALATVAAIACACVKSDRRQELSVWAIRILFVTMLAAPFAAISFLGYKAATGSSGAVSLPVGILILPFLYCLKFEPWVYGLYAAIAIGLIEMYMATSKEKATAPAAVVRPATDEESGRGNTTDGAPRPDVRQKLESLQEMKEAGLISEADYENKKRELLDRFR